MFPKQHLKSQYNLEFGYCSVKMIKGGSIDMIIAIARNMHDMQWIYNNNNKDNGSNNNDNRELKIYDAVSSTTRPSK